MAEYLATYSKGAHLPDSSYNFEAEDDKEALEIAIAYPEVCQKKNPSIPDTEFEFKELWAIREVPTDKKDALLSEELEKKVENTMFIQFK